MFAKISVVLSTLVVLATAIPAPGGAPTGSAAVDQCNTYGSAQCCNTVLKSTPDIATLLHGLLHIEVGSVTGLIGVGCAPISVVAVGGGVKCDQKPVCCQGNQQNGLVNVQCSPISL